MPFLGRYGMPGENEHLAESYMKAFEKWLHDPKAVSQDLRDSTLDDLLLDKESKGKVAERETRLDGGVGRITNKK